MDLITIALGIAKFVPAVLRFLKGDRAGDVAEQVIETAKRITGTDDATQVIDALKKNPEMVVKLQESMNQVVIAAYEAEAAQIAEINQTMRAELVSNHAFKSGWRPFFGWVVGVTWAIEALFIVGICAYAIFKNPATAPSTISAVAELIGAMMVMWSIALGVLGINISKRSQDKQVAAGQSPVAGLLGSVANKILRK